MKCDELKPLLYSIRDLAYVDEPQPEPHFQNPHDNAVYKATEVDAAIDELKAAHHKERHEYIKMIAELKQKLENAQASAYAESVDAGMRDCRLKRALWLARAERASDKARIFYFAETCGVELNIDGFSNKEKGRTRMCTSRWWRLTWLKVERKCRAKAEKYK